jgi:hypothetical protein
MQYRARRYLEHLSEDELIQRAKDVIANQTTLTEEYKIGLHPTQEGGEYWGILFTHILEECALRNYRYPEPFAYRLHDTQIPKYNWPGISKALQVFKAMNLTAGSFLVKFGQYKYLHSTLEAGLIRIMPASYYDDPSLNQAIRDSELQISLLVLPSEGNLEAVDEKTGKSKGILKPIGNINYTLQSSTNYYAYCLASTYSSRLFGDFEADCCLIIKHPQQFVERLIQAFHTKLPEYQPFAEAIKYFDPLNANEADLNVFFSKHFRYSYQKEYRIIWLPPEPVMALEPVFLELGNLEPTLSTPSR